MTHATGSESEVPLRAALSAAYTSAHPSDALRARVAALAENAPTVASVTVRVARKPLRWGLAFAGAMAAVAGVVLAWPSVVAAEMLQRMESRLRDVRSAYMFQQIRAPGGGWKRMGETWYQDGRWRLEMAEPRRVQVFKNGKLWSYSPDQNEVMVEEREGPFSFNPSGLGFSSIVKDFTRWGWMKSVRVERTEQVAGRPAAWIAIEQNNSPERMVFLVDRGTGLPLRMEAQKREGAAWVTGAQGEFRLNQPLSPALFEPNFPTSAQVIDRKRGKAEAQALVERELQRKEMGDRVVVLRDVQRNAQGDVFVMFTTGKFPGDSFPDHEVQMEDGKGRRYSRYLGTFQPYIHGPNAQSRWGLVVGDEVVYGSLFFPTTPEMGAETKEVAFTISVPEQIHHGRVEKGQTLEIGSSQKLVFKIKLPPPTRGLLPDYMQYTGVPVSEADLQEGHRAAQQQ